MNMIQAVKSVFGNYANFKGRARRSEYWLFTLFNGLICLGATILISVLLLTALARWSGSIWSHFLYLWAGGFASVPGGQLQAAS